MKEHYHNEERFDNLFRSSLQEHEETAPMHLWEGIEAKRSFGHIVLNQLRLKWYYGLPVLLAIVAGFWIAGTLDDDNNNWAIDDNQTGVKQAALLALNEKAIAYNSLVAPVKKSSEQIDVQTKIETAPIITEQPEKGAISSEKESLVALPDLVKTVGATVEAVEAVEDKLELNHSEFTGKTAVESKSVIQRNLKAKVTEQEETKGQGEESQGDLEGKELKANGADVVNGTTKESKKIEDFVLMNPGLNDLNSINDVNETGGFAHKKQSALALLNSKHYESVLLGKPDRGCAAFGRKRSKVTFTIDALASPDYSIKRMAARNSEVFDYIDEREKSETFLYGYSAGVRASVTGPRLGFRTGLIFSQINERFDLMQRVVGDSMLVNVNDTIVNGLDTTFVAGVVTVTETRNFKETTYNYYRAFDIPFLLSYNVQKGRVMDVGINGGVFLNIWTKRKGKVLNPALQTVDISGNEYFKNTIGLSVYAGLEMAIHLNYRLDFLLEPNIRYNIQPLTEGDYAVIQRYWTGALALGIRYKLNL